MSSGRLGQLEPLVAVAVTVLATAPFADFYAGWLWLPVLAAAVGLGGLLAALLRSWWWGLAVGALASALLLVATCYPELSFYGAPTAAALRALGGGLVTGVPKMLSVGLPADVAGDVLVPPVVAALLAGAAAVLLCRVVGSVTAPVLPPLLVYVAGLLVTASRPQPRLWVAGAVVLAMLLSLLLRSNRLEAASREGIEVSDAEAVGLDLASRRWHSTMARVAFGLPAIVAASCAAVAAAAVLPIADGSHRMDPRTLREPAFRLNQALSPLAQLRPQLTAPPQQLFQVTVNNPGGSFLPDRVRVAALDEFDGSLWTGTRDFELTGATLAEPERLNPPFQQVELDVRVDSPSVSFLPVLGDPTRITTGDGFAFDRPTATLVRTTPAAGPFRYQVQCRIRPQDESTLRAVASDDRADASRRRLPAAPPWVAELADRVVGDRDTPMSQLLALETYLRGQAYSAQALPGHSYGALKRVLLGVPEDRVGGAEQYAAAFAVLARAEGFATRVAVGYQLRPERRDGATFTVLSSDIHAWPEVHLKDQGWVAFEPTDARSPVLPPPPRGPNVTLAAADQEVTIEQPRQAGLGSSSARTVAIGAAVVAAALVTLALGACLAVVAGKAQRRRRRAKRGSPAQRVAAAWTETLDRLREAGLTVPASATPSEVTEGARRSPVGAAAAGTMDLLAPLVTHVAYGPMEPGEVEAVRSWELYDMIRGQIVRSLSLRDRARAAVDPRALWPRLGRPAADDAAASPRGLVVASGAKGTRP